MLTLCSARAWQSLPSVPGLSSTRIVNSLVVGIGTSLRCTSGMGWRLPARSNDAWNPTPATQTHTRRLLDSTNGLVAPNGTSGRKPAWRRRYQVGYFDEM